MTPETTPQKILTGLFKNLKDKKPATIVELPPSGSERKYYRIVYDEGSLIGVYNPNISENIAFLEFTRHFADYGLPVPTVLAASDPPEYYLIKDLGDQTLFSLLPNQPQQFDFSKYIIDIYKKVLELLPQFQINADKGLNYDVCYPRKYFDSQSMSWDLNYFKYYFLKLAGIYFNEQKLENDFGNFIKYLNKAPAGYFMYRDFQSRNIMVVNDKPWFIDYQGGRKGPLQYDVASLLFDAKANIPFNLRNELLNYYITQLKNYTGINRDEFTECYYGFVLIRIMQAMGTYGFRGLYEKKPLFMQSIPYAQKNLEWLLEQGLFPSNLPHLKDVAKRIIEAEHLKKYYTNNNKETKLKIVIRSFAYKNGIPYDISGNGGGFVFDCRALPNPGKIEEYKQQSGKDTPVIEYLDKEPAVSDFLDKTSKLVMSSVEVYIERGFTNLMVNYGCTGGQHRSVYCANSLARIINKKFDVEVDLEHEEEGVAF